MMRLDSLYILYHDVQATLIAEKMLTSFDLTFHQQAMLRADLYMRWVKGMTEGIRRLHGQTG